MNFLKKHTFAILVTVVLFFVAFIYYSYVSSFYIPNKDGNSEGAALLSELGVFGDFFNGVSAPFLGLVGIALTLITIYAQSQNQLEQSEKQLEQAKLQQESTFVSVFNNLVGEYRTSQRDISVKKGRNVYVGKKVFEILNSELKHFYTKEYLDNNGLNDASLEKKDLVKRAMDLVHADRRLCYEQHFKLLYNILKYIDQKCSEKDKVLYAGMLRSFIPVEEEKFIYYEALQEDFKKFKSLLEKYSMMHDIKNDLLDPEHVDLYNPSAFT